MDLRGFRQSTRNDGKFIILLHFDSVEEAFRGNFISTLVSSVLKKRAQRQHGTSYLKSVLFSNAWKNALSRGRSNKKVQVYWLTYLSIHIYDPTKINKANENSKN